MFWFKRMPDAVLRRYKATDGSFIYNDLIHTFHAEGKRWCNFRGELLLLRDDGTVVGYAGGGDNTAWEML